MKSIIQVVSIFSFTTFSCGPKYTASFQRTDEHFYNKELKVKVENDSHRRLVMENALDDSFESELIKKEQVDNRSPVASTKLITQTETKSKIEEVEAKFEKGGKYNKVALNDLSKSDKKSMLKEVKRDLKSLKKESKISKKSKIYIGIVIALAGLVVAILASGAIGGLAIIVGVVLIAWGIIEQGGI